MGFANTAPHATKQKFPAAPPDGEFRVVGGIGVLKGGRALEWMINSRINVVKLEWCGKNVKKIRGSGGVV